ncbi:MAG: class I tRNA ligase family protein, partial [Rothia sp. (in: high G+C Gram-positive bacteria)]|nr:class I tRNA ligase family protein [Rothia sp. (in: high G+C Gram-positive bacteria)]
DFDQQAFHKALERIWHVIADCNRYFTAQEPWKLKKTDAERMNTVLYVTAETLRQVAILVQPVMPTSMGKMLDLLAVESDDRVFAQLAQPLVAGTELPQPQPVFPRYEEPKGE